MAQLRLQTSLYLESLKFHTSLTLLKILKKERDQAENQEDSGIVHLK